MTEWRGGFHFSGLNNIDVWSADGSRLLKSRTAQLPHNMAPDDQLQVGFVPFMEGAAFKTSSPTWCFVLSLVKSFEK